MNGNNRGFSPIALIIGLVVLAGLVLGGLFVFSDVWRTKIKSGLNDFSAWTPENIAKDPVNYLNFCEEQTNKAVEKLKASEIAISQKKEMVKSKQGEVQNTLAVGKKKMEELKDAYRQADANNAFPVQWAGATLDKDQCVRQILRTAGEIKSKDDLDKMYDQAAKQLQTQSEKVAEAKDEASKQLAKITTNREMLKVQNITDDLKKQLVDMKGVLETSVVAVSATNTGSSVSLDELAAKSASSVDTAKFDEIMKQK